jgi:HD-GYP domain-containing protein (c-di-GMP phosphodiesterase class II)
MTDDYNKYAYWKLQDGTLLEVSVSVPRKHMDKYLEKIRGMLNFPFVNSLAFASLATRKLEAGNPALTVSEDWALLQAAEREGKDRLLLRDGLLKRRLLLYIRPHGEDNVALEEPKLLLLSLDFTPLGKLFGAFLLGILFLLLAGAGGLSIAFDRIVDTLTTPFERLARNMAALAANPGEFEPDQNLTSSSVMEIQELLDSFRSMAVKLSATMEEREAALQQARALYGETRILNDELEQILGVAGRLTAEATSGKETFLPELLRMALQFIPEADCGSISEVNGEEWRFVDAVGHNAELLRTLPLKRTHLLATKAASTFPNLRDALDQRMPPALAEKFRAAMLPARQSLLHSFFLDEEMVGQICLDISERQDQAAAFSLRSERILSAFGNMASAYLGIRRYVTASSSFQKQLVSVMIGILEIYDSYTKGHSENVARLASRLAAALKMNANDISRIYWTGLLHDLGKLLVPVTVLNKPGPLEDEEYEIIKKHPRWGYAVLSSSANLGEIARDVLHHHERWDGKGYPDGLSGEAIPLGARILSVADAFDAMTSCRSYRPAMEKDEALRELERHRGTQFDPAVVDVALRILP